MGTNFEFEVRNNLKTPWDVIWVCWKASRAHTAFEDSRETT